MRFLFIVNPISGGKGKEAILSQIEKGMDSCHPWEIVRTERPGHATELAREADADVIVAVGGDGTVSEVAQGLIGSEKALGIIPCGSGDGLALHLGISRNPSKAVCQLQDGTVETMDYAKVNGKPFFCTTGVGLDAEVAWQFAQSGKRGLWTYISLAWKIWQNYRPDTYTIDVDGQVTTAPAVIVTVGNCNQWGNQARITPLASVQDGLLNVSVVKVFHTWEIPVLAAKLMDGRAFTSRRVQHFEGRHVIVRRTQPGPAHFDGDPFQAGTELDVEVIPAALRVVVPQGKKV